MAHLLSIRPASTAATPLCVDLDGTLLRTDLLHEGVARLLKEKPWLLVWIPIWLLRGRAFLKRQIAVRTTLDVASLPYHSEFVDWLRDQAASGRVCCLVTAADQSVATQVAEHIGIFQTVLASDGRINLKGAGKLHAIRERFPGAFEYAGNSRTDLELWSKCSRAIAVSASPSLVKRARNCAPEVLVFDSARRGAQWPAAVRMQQWVKNILVFVPLITSHQFIHPVLLLKSFAGVVLFSLCSSAQYLLNDLIDLEADRRHATKRLRPFASGRLPLAGGFVLAPLLLAGSLLGAAFLSPAFALILGLYFLVSIAYSLYFKKLVLTDVFVLSGLYTFRIIAGHLLTKVQFSVWLLSFAFFLFLSLAFSKRWAELSNAQRSGAKIAGRGYQVADLGQVNVFGVCSGFLSAVVFILYLQSENVRQLYRQPEFLWLLAPIYLYWISRIWILCSHGQMNEDPIVFVLKDRVFYALAALSGVIMWAATQGWSL